MRILFFAQLRELTGCAEEEIDWHGGDAEAVWGAVIRRWPRLAEVRSGVRLARNGVYAREDENFVNGDEVALIPPVSGG